MVIFILQVSLQEGNHVTDMTCLCTCFFTVHAESSTTKLSGARCPFRLLATIWVGGKNGSKISTNQATESTMAQKDQLQDWLFDVILTDVINFWGYVVPPYPRHRWFQHTQLRVFIPFTSRGTVPHREVQAMPPSVE